MSLSCILTLLLATSSPSPRQTDDPKDLCDLLLAAQAENATKYAAGELEFRIEYQRAMRDTTYLTKKPALAVINGKLVWDRDFASWRYHVHDPDRSFAASERANPLETAPEEARLLLGQEHVLFDPTINKITIIEYNPKFPSNSYLDVRPQSLWFRVFSPLHLDSWPLADLIGPGSKAEMPGDDLAVERIGDRVTHTRTRSSGLSTKMVFSLTNDANLVENHVVYEPGAKGVSTKASYEWARAGTGECYPRRYRQDQFLNGDPSDILGYFSVEIVSIDLAPSDRSADLTKEALFARLPRNTRVDDQLRKVTYVLHPMATLSTEDLDRLVPALQSMGYLKR